MTDDQPLYYPDGRETRFGRRRRRGQESAEFLIRRATTKVRDKYGNDVTVYGPMQVTTNSAMPNREQRRATKRAKNVAKVGA